ncbi:uncharacterized protein BJ171DRAFT_480902 [Polychytrium aggregatum]|uniref:uncharacterized protein n=1 Tax=Polychytrium aggregatum TaxID=110093 RepID=UPI0022FED609|nr:uncharacterized protein BJ171DRAFT_480902 [Polychytrium aggregatum]KAI9193045.1 hypothetical protein BJ171DRAFT_480902 [Polychytrium aggregatum]
MGQQPGSLAWGHVSTGLSNPQPTTASGVVGSGTANTSSASASIDPAAAAAHSSALQTSQFMSHDPSKIPTHNSLSFSNPQVNTAPMHYRQGQDSHAYPSPYHHQHQSSPSPATPNFMQPPAHASQSYPPHPYQSYLPPSYPPYHHPYSHPFSNSQPGHPMVHPLDPRPDLLNNSPTHIQPLAQAPHPQHPAANVLSPSSQVGFNPRGTANPPVAAAAVQAASATVAPATVSAPHASYPSPAPPTTPAATPTKTPKSRSRGSKAAAAAAAAAAKAGESSNEPSSSISSQPVTPKTTGAAANGKNTSPTDDADKVKRPPNAFFLYCQTRRPELHKQDTHMSTAAMSSIMGNEWAAMEETAKEKWKLKATQLRDEYKSIIAANPNRRIRKKSKLTPTQAQTGGPGAPGSKFHSAVESLKRPPNSYILFNKDKRSEIQANNPHLGVGEISRLTADAWKHASEDDRIKYNDMAKEMKKEWSQIQKTAGGKKRKRMEKAAMAGQLEKPKHPTSAFIFYLLEVRKIYHAQNPKDSIGQISKRISEAWKGLDEAERRKWMDVAKNDQLRYAKEMEAYRKSMGDVKGARHFSAKVHDSSAAPLAAVAVTQTAAAVVAVAVAPDSSDDALDESKHIGNGEAASSAESHTNDPQVPDTADVDADADASVDPSEVKPKLEYELEFDSTGVNDESLHIQAEAVLKHIEENPDSLAMEEDDEEEEEDDEDEDDLDHHHHHHHSHNPDDEEDDDNLDKYAATHDYEEEDSFEQGAPVDGGLILSGGDVLGKESSADLEQDPQPAAAMAEDSLEHDDGEVGESSAAEDGMGEISHDSHVDDDGSAAEDHAIENNPSGSLDLANSQPDESKPLDGDNF